jgi:NAD(P)H dehydrogenase (quinone)
MTCNSIHHFGGILVSPGYTDPAHGNPYGTSHHDAFGTAPVGEPTRAAARAQARRVVRFARAIESLGIVA